MSDPIVIAIDGPSASGKSTNSKIIAAELGFVYVDTGAMYRTLAWHALQSGTEVTDAAAVEALCRDWPAELVRRVTAAFNAAFYGGVEPSGDELAWTGAELDRLGAPRV